MRTYQTLNELFTSITNDYTLITITYTYNYTLITITITIHYKCISV